MTCNALNELGIIEDRGSKFMANPFYMRYLFENLNNFKQIIFGVYP